MSNVDNFGPMGLRAARALVHGSVVGLCFNGLHGKVISEGETLLKIEWANGIIDLHKRKTIARDCYLVHA